MGRTVQKSQDSNRGIIETTQEERFGGARKPEPPDDLFVRMSADMAKLGIKLAPPRPTDGTAFTREEFAAKYGVTKDIAKRTIAKLMRAGKVTVVMAGADSYYVYCD